MKKQDDLPGDAIMVRNDGLLTTEVDGELVAMSIEQGACFGLNGVGTRIWELLAEPRSIDDLCAQLCGEFDVDPAVCRSDVVALLNQLRAEGLAMVRDG